MEGTDALIVNRDGALCTLVINNPAKLNALTPDCLIKITETLENLGQNELVRTVVIRGAGEKAFSAGYDITALPDKKPSGGDQSKQATAAFDNAMKAIDEYPYPIIAMLNGFAFGGGCELALTCDIRIAAKHVRMGMPPAKLGLIYRYDGLRRFLTALGYARTLEIFLTGRYFESAKCLEMGLVNHLVENDQLESFTYDLAREVTENAPLSLRGTKAILKKIVEYPVVQAEDIENFHFLYKQAMQSKDLEEGKRAFKEKRKPQFKGH
jgi:enoyl-CoA hydratase/carnithine racemase